jgi:acyl carrier protein
MPAIYDRVKTIVVEKLGVEETAISPDASFVGDLNADSLDLVELIMAFEEEFSTTEQALEISDVEAGQILTVKDAVDHLKGHGVQDT